MSRVLGIRCPTEDADAADWRYRLWFALYRTVRVVEHWLGRHQKPQGYSIAPRCDWCGHRSPKQRAIAEANWRSFDEAAAHFTAQWRDWANERTAAQPPPPTQQTSERRGEGE